MVLGQSSVWRCKRIFTDPSVLEANFQYNKRKFESLMSAFSGIFLEYFMLRVCIAQLARYLV